jgi:hypothetical protein
MTGSIEGFAWQAPSPSDVPAGDAQLLETIRAGNGQISKPLRSSVDD